MAFEKGKGLRHHRIIFVQNDVGVQLVIDVEKCLMVLVLTTQWFQDNGAWYVLSEVGCL